MTGYWQVQGQGLREDTDSDRDRDTNIGMDNGPQKFLLRYHEDGSKKLNACCSCISHILT